MPVFHSLGNSFARWAVTHGLTEPSDTMRDFITAALKPKNPDFHFLPLNIDQARRFSDLIQAPAIGNKVLTADEPLYTEYKNALKKAAATFFPS